MARTLADPLKITVNEGRCGGIFAGIRPDKRQCHHHHQRRQQGTQGETETIVKCGWTMAALSAHRTVHYGLTEVSGSCFEEYLFCGTGSDKTGGQEKGSAGEEGREKACVRELSCFWNLQFLISPVCIG